MKRTVARTVLASLTGGLLALSALRANAGTNGNGGSDDHGDRNGVGISRPTTTSGVAPTS